jgi:hypothetical protein
MSLRASLSEYQAAFQGELFPALEEALGPLPERYGRFVQVLSLTSNTSAKQLLQRQKGCRRRRA